MLLTFDFFARCKDSLACAIGKKLRLPLPLHSWGEGCREGARARYPAIECIHREGLLSPSPSSPLPLITGGEGRNFAAKPRCTITASLTFVLLFTITFPLRADSDKDDAKSALRPFADLIGSWRGTGIPEGTREDKQHGFWSEKLEWTWKFKGNDAWLALALKDGKYFSSGELHYLPEKKSYELALITLAKERQLFSGELKARTLTLERSDDHEAQRITLTLLHADRFLYSFDKKPAGRGRFARVYQVGATKEGSAFAAASNTGPECIVTGGLGKIPVSYKGQTYHVCCSGCRDAFMENPEKCIKEAAERKKKESAEK
jgi:hypothetical protein